jgi:REP element-mobilizing transposase RayT
MQKGAAMPQSLDAIVLHIIFSTHGRKPTIPGALLPRLHAYVGTAARNAGCRMSRVGGTRDHVHAAVHLPRRLAPAKLVEQVKSSASRWMSEQPETGGKFQWQRGYAVFSVSPRDEKALHEYIDNQEEHHRRLTFQEELERFCAKYGVEFDPRHLRD